MLSFRVLTECHHCTAACYCQHIVITSPSHCHHGHHFLTPTTSHPPLARPPQHTRAQRVRTPASTAPCRPTPKPGRPPPGVARLLAVAAIASQLSPGVSPSPGLQGRSPVPVVLPSPLSWHASPRLCQDPTTQPLLQLCRSSAVAVPRTLAHVPWPHCFYAGHSPWRVCRLARPSPGSHAPSENQALSAVSLCVPRRALFAFPPAQPANSSWQRTPM